jgi:hypothetical protein
MIAPRTTRLRGGEERQRIGSHDRYTDGAEAGLIRLKDLGFRKKHPGRRFLKGRGDQVLLKRRKGDRAAGFASEHLGDFRPAPLHDLASLQEQAGTFGRRRLGPGRKRVSCGLHRNPGVLGSAGRNLRVQLAAERLVNVKCSPARGGAPLAARVVCVRPN